MDRSYDVVIEVVNGGKSPAFGVHLALHFPDGLDLVKKEEFGDLLPQEPAPPEKPRDWLSRIANVHIPLTTPHFPDIPPVFASEHMSIKKTNSFEVEWDSKKIRQSETKKLVPMILAYQDDPFSFEVTFEATADNITNKIKGSVHVCIDKSSQD